MSSFLIDKNSPIRNIGSSMKQPRSRLRHRSRPSESEQDSFQENRKPEFDRSNAYPSACSSNGEEENGSQTLHDDEFPQPPHPRSNPSMISYFMSELMKGYKLEDDAREFVERRDRVYTSVNTPKNLEKFCAFGFLQCLDSILNIVTFLPLRILVALVKVIIYPISVIFLKDKRILDSAQICDLLKGVILVVSCFLTSYMDMSMIYHIVRGQSIIKFYVFYNMLDVMDKLISGFGQDVLDSLYWTAVEPRGRKREHFGMIFHLIFAIVYVVSHTMMILIQAIILNVAFNSHNKNLLTIMLSNNFVELKGNLFKRLDKNNLCQITYSDVKERFHYLVLLLFVLIRNMKELEWSWDLAFPFIQDAVIVFGVEIVVDWVKHAFITKFNELSASFYDDFALGLAQDIASSRKKHAFTDFSDQVCRRMGFTPIPLICLLFMVCSKSFTINGMFAWFLVFVFYLCLVSSKVLNSIILLGWAQYLTTSVRTKSTKPSGTVVNSQVIPKKEDKGSSSKPPDKLSPQLHKDIPTLSQISPVDGTSILEDRDVPLESFTNPCSSSFNGDESFHVPSFDSEKIGSVSPLPRRHSSSASASAEVIERVIESNNEAENEAKPHEPPNVPCTDAKTTDNLIKAENANDNQGDDLFAFPPEEEVQTPASHDIESSDFSELSSVEAETKQDDAFSDSAAEPFMFKLSNSKKVKPPSHNVPFPPEDNMCSSANNNDSNMSIPSSNQFPETDLVSDREAVPAEEADGDLVDLSDKERVETDVGQ